MDGWLDRHSVGRTLRWSGRLVTWMDCCLVCRTDGWLTDGRSVGCSVGPSDGRSNGRSVGWLLGQTVKRTVGRMDRSSCSVDASEVGERIV